MALPRVVPALLLMMAAPLAFAAGLTAGEVDDHLNWDAYLAYLERTGGGQTPLPALELGDRITVRVLDKAGMPMAFAEVTASDGTAQVQRTAGSDGIVRLFPAQDGLEGDIDIAAAAPGGIASATARVGQQDTDRDVTVAVDGPAEAVERLDLMFVIDATGSMGDEMAYLTAELDAIIADAVAAHQGTDMRLGLIVYRDAGDAYVVRDLGFSDSISTLRSQLAAQAADGGGDMPEAMDQALAAAVDAQWRSGATARMLFLVADAPPHVEGYGPFMDAVAEAQDKGIHVYPLAASGVDRAAEYLMRSAAALTQGRYLFLTDDSGIGNGHAEPTIPCYIVTELKDLMARVIASEMAGQRIEPAATDVVRTVGDYHLGVCLADPAEADQGDGAPDGASGVSSGTATSSAWSGTAAAGSPGSGSGGTFGTGTGTGASYVDADAAKAADGSAGATGADRGSASKTPGPGVPLLALALIGLVALRRRP